ncbi:2-hydroxyacid dehydrogenase [Croceivirga sp. JEA036]|uniref:2-hydroxyacid dehydrogenase n=1 Tax=Croceivirga sp. JEA036 TaxID=2721162 RepID=UPI00143B96A0|nr:glyoxylate/hydroxypyruvate reductase A [Croceivirga sp. JEA036]NJB37822.1 glyoxylate/hydroxypyruvate reductase A [Croceivirga sp. JEA036]
MSIVICFTNKDPKPWQEELKRRLPKVKVEIHPQVSQKEEPTFALCWKADFDVLKTYPNVRVLQSVGASVDHIINTQKLPPEVVVTRVVDQQLAKDMFTYVLAGILNFIRGTNCYQKAQTNKVWGQKSYNTIAETQVCLLGLGKIGAYVATELAGMGFKVTGWAKNAKNLDGVSCFYGKTELSKAVAKANVLINMLPYTADTEGILNKNLLMLLPQNAFLINVGRGEHLVEEDLLAVLNMGHFSGALLDVFRTEPLPENHPFWEHDKIQITPHVAALTNIGTATAGIVMNYNKAIAEEDLLNQVSIHKGY